MNNNDMKGGGKFPKTFSHKKPSATTNPPAKIPGGVPRIGTGAKKDNESFKPTGPNHKNGDFSR